MQSYKDDSLPSKKKSSQGSIQNIEVVPMKGSPTPLKESPKVVQVPSNDVSDIYRVINSDIQYRKSKKHSETEAKKPSEQQSPKLAIENGNLERNKQEYMKKIETKITQDKFQNNLKLLDFTDDLERDDDMAKMKEHAKKLQAIRIQKQASGVDSAKEQSEASRRRLGREDPPKPEKTLVQVENMKIDLETLGVGALDSKNNTRPLSMENDFIPELIDSKGSKPGQSNKDSAPSRPNGFRGDYSNTDYEKRNNGSFDQSYEPFEKTKSKDESRKLSANRASAKRKKEFSEDSQKNELLTYGAHSSRR